MTRSAAKDEFYPCSDCHELDADEAPNLTPRELEEEHAALRLVHGGGRFWCMQCHAARDRDALRSVSGEAIQLSASETLCADCHSPQYRDFTRGLHGKRLHRFEGPRVLAPCVSCHDPHRPAIRPRAPMAGPGARARDQAPAIPAAAGDHDGGVP